MDDNWKLMISENKKLRSLTPTYHILRISFALMIMLSPTYGFSKSEVKNLPEFVVSGNRNRLLHVLAYVREYSSMSTYSDTIFMFREKMVDFMIPAEKSNSKLGWTLPRILSSNSYYRFTDSKGLDSVSATCRHHFSWSDWIGIPQLTPFPKALALDDNSTDTIRVNQCVNEIWNKKEDHVGIKLDLLSLDFRKKWVPELAELFKETVEFYRFNIDYDYDNVLHSYISPLDISSFFINVESNGRGRDMFRFSRRNQSVYYTTEAEVYILDREFITSKEAGKWDKRKFQKEAIPIIAHPDAPPLKTDILSLIERVSQIDTTAVRVLSPVDQRIGYRSNVNNFTIGNRLLNLLKDLTGITLYKSKKNTRDRWRDFKETVRHWNDSTPPPLPANNNHDSTITNPQ